MYLQRVKLPETTFIGDFIVRLDMRGQFEIFEIMVFALTYTKLTRLITNTRFPEHGEGRRCDVSQPGDFMHM